MLRHPWFSCKGSKVKEIYSYVPKIISEIQAQEVLRDKQIFLDNFFNDIETNTQIDFSKIMISLFSLKELVYFWKILNENQEDKLIFVEFLKRPDPTKTIPFFIDNTNEMIYYNNNKEDFSDKLITLPLSNLLVLLKNEILKFITFKNSNHKDFPNAFIQNLQSIAKNFSSIKTDDSLQKNAVLDTNSNEKSNLKKTNSNVYDNFGKRFLNKISFGSKITRLFSSNLSSKSSGDGKETNNNSKVIEEDILVYFSVKTQIYLFYLSYFNSLSTQKKTTSIYNFLYKLPMPENLRIKFWRKILEVEYDSNVLFSFIMCDNHIYPEKNKFLSQIESDIPRCHQYHPLLNSYHGKLKLYEVLVSIMNFNQNTNYIQGLDSMGTVVLEATVFKKDVACVILGKIIDKTIRNFLNITEEKNYVKEYLLIFQWILFFTEPLLAQHLVDIGFLPELYAISWILNLFSSNIT